MNLIFEILKNKMNNLPYDVLQNIIHYADESAKYINSRFYEIVLDCKWNYKLIDLSTITMEYLKELKNSNVEYIKVIVTKNRSKEKLIEVIKYLFDTQNLDIQNQDFGPQNGFGINKFKLKGIYIDVPLCFKSNEEIDFLKQYINIFFQESKNELSIVFQLLTGIHKQIFLDNLIINLNEYSDAFNINLTNDKMTKLKLFVCRMNHNFLKYKSFKNHKINNFIYIPCNFNLKNNFSVCNGKTMYIDDNNHLISLNILPYKNVKIILWSEDRRHPIFSIYNNDGEIIPNKTLRLSFKDTLIKSTGLCDLNKILKLK